MPSLRFTCPGCDATLSLVQAMKPGATVHCPRCGAEVDVPTQPARPRLDTERAARNLERPKPSHGAAATEPLEDEVEEELEQPIRPVRKRRRLRKKKQKKPFLLGLAITLGLLAFLAASVGGFLLLAPSLKPTSSTPRASLPPSGKTSYLIQIKTYGDPGTTMDVRMRATMVASARVFNTEGKKLSEVTEKSGDELDFSLAMVEKVDNHPRRYQIMFKKAISIVGDKKNPQLYQGRTVRFELDQGECRAVPDRPLPPEVISQLITMTNIKGSGNLVQSMTVSKPVQINEPFNVTNAEQFAALLLTGAQRRLNFLPGRIEGWNRRTLSLMTGASGGGCGRCN